MKIICKTTSQKRKKALPGKKKFTTFLACCLLSSALAPIPALADEPEEQTPTVYFEHCSISFLPDKIGSDGYPLRYLNNDLFYIEYPGSWFFGTNNISPIVFFNDSEMPKDDHDFETFQDDALIGPEDQVDQHIQGGGLAPYFQQVLAISDLTGYQYRIQTKEYGILVYSLEKDGDTVASIIVWTSFGQLSIRDERPSLAANPLRDYGKIMVMPEWDWEDFHSLEAIQAYVDSGKLNDRLMLDASQLTWITKPYQTEHLTYLLCEGSCDFLKLSVYIPVTPAGVKNWMISFDVFIDSEINDNAYAMQEEIISTFKILK